MEVGADGGVAYTPTVPDVSHPGVHAPAGRDTSPDLLRLFVLHGVLVAVPVLVVAGLVLGLLLGALGVILAAVVAVAVGAGVTAARLRDVDDRVASAVGARPATAEEFPRLHSLAENVAMAVGVAPPALFVIDAAERNALTWGDGRRPLCTAFTSGLLDAVDRIQLEALLGRQLAVARDGSVDVLTVAATLFSKLRALDAPVASVARHAIDDRAVIEADLEGVRATGYPPGLVAALEVVRAGSPALASVPRALVGACLAAPDDVPGPFAVHPPLADRIDLLREM